MELVHTLEGVAELAMGLGKALEIEKEVLQPYAVDSYQIFYSNYEKISATQN